MVALLIQLVAEANPITTTTAAAATAATTHANIGTALEGRAGEMSCPGRCERCKSGQRRIECTNITIGGVGRALVGLGGIASARSSMSVGTFANNMGAANL
jgi:hypothetical protein